MVNILSVSGCHDCHGAQLAGGKCNKSGATPSGHALNPAEMPWKSFNNYSDDELKSGLPMGTILARIAHRQTVR
jgi:hypothetical protein